mmetsp:Transcript_42237/g.126585  ORF Transcript_42237/g.126585 Transcript_42237/m.126585 type:complete len:94 (+) Transcript_42237:733-1014(+)|eukprot:357392-Chlamydomonas_euryale.AAC.22
MHAATCMCALAHAHACIQSICVDNAADATDNICCECMRAFWVPLGVGLCTGSSHVSLNSPCEQANLFGGTGRLSGVKYSTQSSAACEAGSMQA